jgi:DNA-binding Lrp family transcriptional regulator
MTYNLDLKDRKILYELDLNSRQSYNELARKVKLSKTALLNRISNMQKEGMIKSFNAIIDMGKLGYIGFRLYLKLNNASKEKEKEIIKWLKEKEIVSWIVSIAGDYDIGLLILVKTISEMNILWKEMLEKYINYIDERLLTIMTGVSYFSRAYLLNLKKNEYEIEFATEPREMYVDEKDKEILKLLAGNARIPVVEIASKTRLTPKTVIQRIKNLEKKKIIIGYKPSFDLEKLGYQYYKLFFRLNNITRDKEKEFRLFVKHNPNIIYDDKVLGGDDFEIEVQIENNKKLRELVDEIRGKFSSIIKEYKVMQFYKEHKFLFLPLNV